MPRIFDESGRERVQEQLLEAGFDLIKQYGLRKTSISDIAQKAGIATGTFYNFYKSKEEFVYQIVLYKRNVVKGYFETLIKSGNANRKGFRDYLRVIYHSDNNIFDYLNESEMAILNARWPKEYWKNKENDENTSEWMLSNLDGVSSECNWRVFANLTKSISLIRYGRVRLYPEEYEESLDIYIDAIVDYVFGKQ